MEEVTMATRLSIRKAVIVSAAAALISVVLAAPVAAQENYGLKIYTVESGLYPYVQVYFRTFDQNEEPLVNLNYSNIGLMVKGRSYDPRKGQYGIQPLRQRPEAVRSVLVIDASKSMAGSPFEAALKAAALFIDSKRPQDQIAILAIRDTEKGYEVVSNWERDREALGRRLADIRADGMNTRLYDSIGAAMQMSAMMGQESHDPGAAAGGHPRRWHEYAPLRLDRGSHADVRHDGSGVPRPRRERLRRLAIDRRLLGRKGRGKRPLPGGAQLAHQLAQRTGPDLLDRVLENLERVLQEPGGALEELLRRVHPGR
jgi:ParB-like chromosome segregation protein Spo0J